MTAVDLFGTRQQRPRQECKDKTMTPEQCPRAQTLRTAMNAIHRQLDAGMMPAELFGMAALCEEIQAFTRDHSDAGAQAWHRAAVVTERLLYERGEGVRAEWIAAYAGLPPMDQRKAKRKATRKSRP
jgi:hypothetical protein